MMSSIEEVAKTIDLIIAPVVTITACAVMINGLITRYGSLGDRLRTVNPEPIWLTIRAKLREDKNLNPC
jgi:hypothetical protein